MADPENLFWLCLSALTAGVINSVAGGGTLLTFPALVAVLEHLLGKEEAARVANATSTAALMPGSLAGTWGYRREMVAARHWTLLLLAPSLAGGVVGSLLVTRLDAIYFATLVPWLILTAALLFMIQPLLARFIRSRLVSPVFEGEKEPAEPTGATRTAILLFQFVVAVYGGYFGAGIGILMLSALALMGVSSVHQMNAVKTFLAFCINGISVVIFALEDKVVWRLAAAMALSAILGGYLGARVARRVPPRLVRWCIIVIGLGLSAYYFHRQFFGSR